MSAPKNSVSVARKTHMPSCDASPCWSSVANWISGWTASAGIRGAVLRHIAAVLGVVAVGGFGHDRRAWEIVRRRRRRGLPFEPGRAPRVRAGTLAVEERPAEIKERQEIGHRQD